MTLLSASVYANTTTLNFLEVMTSPERTALLKGMIAEYEKLNPDIKINLISPPYEQSDQKATLMLNTNQPLDIIEVRDYTVKQFVNNKKLTDLTEHFGEWSDAETLTSVASATLTVDNTPYLVPQSILSRLSLSGRIFWRPMARLYPETIEELVEAHRRLIQLRINMLLERQVI